MQKYFEKIIERLKEQKEKSAYITDGIANRRIYDNGIKNAIEIVNQVAEEYGKDTNVPSNDGWIPCKQFMPAELGEDWVQVQIQERDTGFLWIPRTAEYRGDKWWLTDSDEPLEDVFEVTAWRKLPSYYQPKGEEV